MDISKLAADAITDSALAAAEEPLKQGLGQLLGEQLGSYVGLGAGQTVTEGETWQERLGNSAKFLGQAAAIIIAGKAVGSALYADGGWIGSNPTGGVIRAGSGHKDDVFLGYTGGGSVANYGMGGEFVIPRRQTAKHLPLLEAIRTDNFAEGGPISDPMTLAHDMNGGGFSTFFKEWIDTGNYKEGIKAAIIYYLSSALMMTAGKTWGGEVLEMFHDGGMVKNFADGGPVADEYDGSGIDTNLTAQILKWIEEWTGAGSDITDPGGIAVGVDEVMSALNDWGGSPTDQMSIGKGLSHLWDINIPKWLDLGATTTAIEGVDKLLVPFATDILTPGSGIDFPSHLEYQFGDAIEEVVADGVENLLTGLTEIWDITKKTLDPLGITDNDTVKKVLDPFDIFAEGGLLGSYASGTDYVPETGPYLLHKGEKVTTAAENASGGCNQSNYEIIVTPIITVKIGEEDFTNKVEIIAESVIIERESRGLSGSGQRAIY